MAENRLSESQNPYLLQHAKNPVHWFEWSDKAFEAAKKLDKPVFLSIGYATCHWCHVMAHESFEDETVAGMMNEAFISIKVDREERPDIDNTYMPICQMLTGRGGWPLTIVMTSDKKPFYAATYLPKNSRHGTLGMMALIPRLQQFWNEQRTKVEDSAEEITQAFQKSIIANETQSLPDSILDETFRQLTDEYDAKFGGFGSAPKFPTPHKLIFMLRYSHIFGDERAGKIAAHTLTSMRRGGMFDHLGGGFHRYSTDRRWLLPHFEKMLYDQALHLMAYTEAWQLLGNSLYEQTVWAIADYMSRDLQHKDGAFYAAEDADSEGEEGIFYVWSVKEIRKILSPAEAELATEVFNLEQKGNFADESTGQPTGKNILHCTKSMAKLAEDRNLSEEHLRKELKGIKNQLFNYREKRERPFLDDKILTDWNGLAIAALAKAGRALDKQKYIDKAKSAADFIFNNLTKKDGRLLHRYRNGEVAVKGTADDYAFFIFGLLELYQSTFETVHLKKAVELQRVFLETHWNTDHGGFYFTSQNNEVVLGRKQEFTDSAFPSGNSIAAMNLLRLGRITGKADWEAKADEILQQAAGQICKAKASFTQLLQAHLWSTEESCEIVIAGEKESVQTQAFFEKLQGEYLPHAVVILNEPRDDLITELAPYTRSQTMQDGKTTGYVCRNYRCKEPTHSPERMIELMSSF